MSDYEALLRAVFPSLYDAALRLSESEEEAAWVAQVAFQRAYREEIAARDGGVAL